MKAFVPELTQYTDPVEAGCSLAGKFSQPITTSTP